MNQDIYKDHAGLALFMRLYARFICCPCMENRCSQCKIDIGTMNESGLIDVAARIDPHIAKLKVLYA